MKVETAIIRFAGLLILVLSLLGLFVNSQFIWGSVIVSFMLLQSSYTGFCPAAMMFKRLGFNIK